MTMDGDTANQQTFAKDAGTASSADANVVTEIGGLGSSVLASIWAGMDEMAIFNRIITNTEIQNLYNSGNAQAIYQEQLLRTINLSDMTLDTWNFIRFNGVHSQLLKIEGSSGNTLVMSANELAVQLESDPPLTTKHGQFTIDPANANLPLNGGDPTTSVIDDPSTTSMTLVNGGTQNDPVTGAMVMWQQTLDANNDVSRSIMKIDGAFREVRWF